MREEQMAAGEKPRTTESVVNQAEQEGQALRDSFPQIHKRVLMGV